MEWVGGGEGVLLSEAKIHCMCSVGGQQVWVGCEDGAMIAFDNSNGRVLRHYLRLHSKPIRGLLATQSHHLWSLGENAVRIWISDAFGVPIRQQQQPTGDQSQQGIPLEGPLQLVLPKEGRLSRKKKKDVEVTLINHNLVIKFTPNKEKEKEKKKKKKGKEKKDEEERDDLVLPLMGLTCAAKKNQLELTAQGGKTTLTLEGKASLVEGCLAQLQEALKLLKLRRVGEGLDSIQQVLSTNKMQCLVNVNAGMVIYFFC